MTTTAPVSPNDSQQKPARNLVGLIALGIAVVAVLMAVIPPTSFFAWLPAVAAIVLAIIGATRRGQTKGMAVTALVLAPVAWIIAIVVALGTTVVAVDDAMNDSGTTVEQPADDADESVEEAPAEEVPAGVGTPVMSDTGVTYTVASSTCGIPTAGSEYYPETAAGQFCEVKATISNAGTDAFDMYTSTVEGYIDGAEYEPNNIVSTFGGDAFGKTINPGLTVDVVLYFDVPADRPLQSVAFSELFSFDDAVTINLV